MLTSFGYYSCREQNLTIVRLMFQVTKNDDCTQSNAFPRNQLVTISSTDNGIQSKR